MVINNIAEETKQKERGNKKCENGGRRLHNNTVTSSEEAVDPQSDKNQL